MARQLPEVTSVWSYLTSTSFVRDVSEAAYLIKKSIGETWDRLLHTRVERRVAAAHKKDRPDLEKIGWSPLNLARTFELPPLMDKMQRVDGNTLSVEEFRENYERTRTPCIITGLTTNWKAHENWKIEALLKKYADVPFKCGESPDAQPVRMKLKYYAEYMKTTNDDSPLYIFDGTFGEQWATEDMLHDYEVPTIFQYNLFDVLGAHKKRPSYRWIVIGPARSGTNIHIDPLGTSAWNALIHGHKRWVFIHPDTPRELVHIPKDQRGVHPKEAVTWFNTVYKRICEGNWPFDKYPVLECRQNPGETLFVPCGWWHVVINEDETVAVTQNFCSPVNLVHVYPTLLKQRPKLAQLFTERLSEEQPELMDIVHESMFDPKPISNGYTSSDDEESSECSNGSDDDDDSDTDITLYSTDLSYFESEEEDYESEDVDHSGGEANEDEQQARRGAGDEAPSLSEGSQQSGRGLDTASEEGEGDAKMQTFMDQVYKPYESSSSGLKRRAVRGST